MVNFNSKKTGIFGISVLGSPTVFKVVAKHYSSIFLGRWPLPCGHPSKHSVPHGKLVKFLVY